MSTRGRLFWAVFLVALVVRGTVLWTLDAYPRFELIRNRLDDQVVFDAWAKSIVRGEAFDIAATGHEFARWAALRPGVHPQAPLYPWFLATVYRVVGPRYDVVRALQLLGGAAAAGGIAVLAASWVAVPAAAIAGLGGAFYGPQIFYESTFLRAGLFGTVAIATLLLLRPGPRPSGSRSRRLHPRHAALGLVLGAGCLLRPTYLLVAFGALAWTSYRDGRRAGVLASAVLAATLLPVVLGNSLRSGELAFLSSNGPFVLYNANVHDATGTTPTPPPSYDALIESRPLAEIDLVRETIADVARHPLAWLRLEGHKVLAFFGPREGPNNVSFAMGRDRNPLLRGTLDWPLVAPWAALGLVVAIRRWRETTPLLLFLATYVAGTVAFHVLGRIRQPAMLALLIVAAFAVDRVLAMRPLRGVAASIVLIGLGLSLRPAVDHRPSDHLMAAAASFSRAQQRVQTDDRDGALHDLIAALVSNPSHDDARALLRKVGFSTPSVSPAISGLCVNARSAFEEGRTEEALAALERLTREVPQAALPFQYLANLHHLRGQDRAALQAMEEALRRDPLNAVYARNVENLREVLRNRDG